MTVESSLSKAVYNGNGVTREFPFTFKVWDTSQIKVTLADQSSNETDVTSNATVTLSATGGTVTYPRTGSPMASGYKLAITRDMTFLQGVDLISATRFDPQVMEDALDQAAAERQQLKEAVDRAVLAPATAEGGGKVYAQEIFDARDSALASKDAAAASASSAAASATAANNSKNQAASILSQTQAAGTTAVNNINTAGAQKLDAINTAGATQLNAVNTAGEQKVAAVNSAGAAQVSAVNSAGTTQMNRVVTAGDTQTARVNQAGSTQLAAVNSAGAGKIEAINDAAATQMQAITEETALQYQRIHVAGELQTERIEDYADRAIEAAEAQADRAQAQAQVAVAAAGEITSLAITVEATTTEPGVALLDRDHNILRIQVPKGADGATPTFVQGTTITGDAGTLASVSLRTVTTDTYALDFIIPRGATGAAGRDGERGPAGPTGDISTALDAQFIAFDLDATGNLILRYTGTALEPTYSITADGYLEVTL